MTPDRTAAIASRPSDELTTLDHVLLTGQLTVDRLEALRPRTRWYRMATPSAVRHEPLLVDLGTYVQPQQSGLRVIVTLDMLEELGAGNWLHLSVSRERRLPTWGDLVTARDALGYEDVHFVQQLPPRKHWLSVHNFCLHLLCRLDQETVPRVLWEHHGDGSNYEHAKGGPA